MTELLACSTGGFYTAPIFGQVVNSSQPVNITWDTTCLDTPAVDIFLYAPMLASSLIRKFDTVDYSKGFYEVCRHIFLSVVLVSNFTIYVQATIMPRWWNASATVDLQLVIVTYGQTPYEASLLYPAAPIWSATYTAPAAGQPVPAEADVSIVDSGITLVDNLPKEKSVNKGGIAAGVLVPLIFIGLAIFGYIRFSRMREAKRRKRVSEAIDKRMSVISTDWRSITTKGADAAIRASFGGDRLSTYGRNSIIPRASSTFATEGGADDGSESGQQMSQIRRPGVGPRGPILSTGERVSRVSFAADTRFSRSSVATRPSGESRRAGVQSRAFHSSYIPPVPPVNVQSDSDSDPERAMSPTQKDGPLSLSADDIRARVRGLQTGDDSAPRPSIDEVIPALSMMRFGNGSQADLLFGQDSPKDQPDNVPQLPPVAAVTPSQNEAPMSPIGGGAMPMSMHAAVSPDEMLRVYAERRKTGASTAGSSIMSPISPMSPPVIAFPLPVATNTPPTLTTTVTSVSTTTNMAGVGVNAQNGSTTNPFRRSMAVKRQSDEYDYDEAYLGTAA